MNVFFCGLFSVMPFTFLCLFVVILLFKMAPKHHGEGLPSGPKWEKAGMCLGENKRFHQAQTKVLLAVSSRLMKQCI